MVCTVWVFVGVGLFLGSCSAFNANVNGSLQYTALENIVKRGIQRLCDRQSENVLKKCKRPLVKVSEIEGEFDLHTRVGRPISEVLGLNLDEVNQRLSNEIKKELSTVESCRLLHDVLSLKLRDEYLLEGLEAMLGDERLAVGRLTDERVLVDYFSPNVGKSLHMGHIRSLAIGQSLSNLLEFAGSKVMRRNHIGDFGLQSGVLMRYLIEYDVRAMEALDDSSCDRDRLLEKSRRDVGFSMWDIKPSYRRKKLEVPTPIFANKLIVETMDTYYKLACDKFATDPEFRYRARLETTDLQNAKSHGQVQWNKIREVTERHYNDILDFFYIKGLKNVPESLYGNLAKKLVKKLVSEGNAAEENECVVITLSNLQAGKSSPGSDPESNQLEGDEAESAGEQEEVGGRDSSVDSEIKDSVNKSVLKTAEGSFTYMATDLAALGHRIKWNKPDRIIYVTEKNQKSHFNKLYRIARALKMLKGCEMEHIGFGQVSLEGSGKLRSRTGAKCGLIETTKKVLDLVGEEIVKRGDYLGLKKPVLSRKIGVGSLIFSDLSVEPGSGYKFSLERLMNQGNNRLISILYAYVRAMAILRKAQGLETVEKREFRNAAERRLGLALLGFENTVLAALAMREPHRICKYLLNLAQLFSQFYRDTHVITDGVVSGQSLKLVKLAARAMELGLGILNIQTVKSL